MKFRIDIYYTPSSKQVDQQIHTIMKDNFNGVCTETGSMLDGGERDLTYEVSSEQFIPLTNENIEKQVEDLITGLAPQIEALSLL